MGRNDVNCIHGKFEIRWTQRGEIFLTFVPEREVRARGWEPQGRAGKGLYLAPGHCVSFFPFYCGKVYVT